MGLLGWVLAAGCSGSDAIYVPVWTLEPGDGSSVAVTLPADLSVSRALADGTAFDAFVAMRGEEVLVRWGDTELPTNVASVRKSIVSLQYGIAADRGLVDLDATLAPSPSTTRPSR